MDLGTFRENWSTDDQTWIRSRHGLTNGVPATLDLSSFTKATHYPDGYLKSGLPLTYNSTSKLHELWATGKTLAGFLLGSVTVPLDGVTDPVGPCVDRVSVVKANLPVAVDAAGLASCPTIRAY